MDGWTNAISNKAFAALPKNRLWAFPLPQDEEQGNVIYICVPDTSTVIGRLHKYSKGLLIYETFHQLSQLWQCHPAVQRTLGTR